MVANQLRFVGRSSLHRYPWCAPFLRRELRTFLCVDLSLGWASLSPVRPVFIEHDTYPWRIHGAAVYANMTGVYLWDPCYHIYSSTMDPSWDMKPSESEDIRIDLVQPWESSAHIATWRCFSKSPNGEHGHNLKKKQTQFFKKWGGFWWVIAIMFENQQTGVTLWWSNIAMERSTIFNGNIHYFYGHFPLLC